MKTKLLRRMLLAALAVAWGSLLPEAWAQSRDFGDAPAPYPTLLNNNGAWHPLSGPRLGALADSESDGQPGNASALGDDLNPSTSDDEDGVVFLTLLTPGQQAMVQVTVSANARLDAWMDFGLDGGWQVGDQIFNTVQLAAGVHTLFFNVPAASKIGTSYARFRVSTAGDLQPTGGASNGEVEDYRVFITDVFDFGDAPAPSYPTLLNQNGARHTFSRSFCLGAFVDGEVNGQPDANAKGDDNTPAGVPNDEDGIKLVGTLVPGSPAQVEVTCTMGSTEVGRLNAWVDFNQDGDWDSGEQIFSDEPVGAGTKPYAFNVPTAAVGGATFARFRLNREGKLGVTGAATDGEVEDYEVSIQQALDFGDAPAPYPTTIKDNGASHAIVGPRLGVNEDAEPDGQPDGSALGDDLVPPGIPDDEDGITLLTPLVPASLAQVEVVASGNFDRALLDAWIDFGADGSWADPGDQIFVTVPVSPGTNFLSFDVPPNAKIGTSFARFRISINGKLSYTGHANNGEVEDHKFEIVQEQLDFGDAPGKFPTLLSMDGARHIVDPLFGFGVLTDLEADGQPEANALGDDQNPATADDEDGITLLTAIEPGKTAAVRVVFRAPGSTAPGFGFMNAWMDFNRNESWADNGEQIFTNKQIFSGTSTQTFLVPATASTGATFARFRVSKQGGQGIGGLASDGEVEDYRVNIEQQLDFGDAPTSYRTLLANDGARHDFVRDYNLGVRVDVEPDGQPTAAANGDDVNPPQADDEDGVTFTSAVVAGRAASVQVLASRAGTLYAWFDFNLNGTFADAGERIFGGVALANGVNNLTFNVPAGAKTGRSYARFRFTVQGGVLDYFGRASDGEVEDYVVSVIPDRDRCDLGCEGREFWLTFPGNYDPDTDNPTKPSLCIQGGIGTTGTVSIAALGFTTNFTIPASLTVNVPLPKAADLGDLNDGVTNAGIHVVGSADLRITAFNHARYTTDSYQALHTSTLGRDYIVLGFGNVHEDAPPLNGSQFALVATETNTLVRIIPSVTTGGHPAGVPFYLTLQPGDAYQLRCTNDAPADLTGTFIKSSAPIAVFGSHLCANIPSSNVWFCDYIVEQLLPVNTWGNEFYTAPLATRTGGDTFRLLAAYDGTAITINGFPLSALNRGQFHQLPIGVRSHILASRPILVAQYANSADYDGNDNSDPFMILLQATRHYSSGYLVCTPTNDFPTNYVQIVAPTSAVASVQIDGVVVGAGAFQNIAGSTYAAANVLVGTGRHIVVAGAPFGISSYGWAQYDSYGHPGCFFFGDVQPPQVTPAATSLTANVASYPNSPGQAPVPSIVGTATTSDNCSPELDQPTQTPTAGTLLPPGIYTLTMSLADMTGNIGETNVTFTVTDPSAVVITCPSNMVVNCNTNGGAIVSFTVNAHTTYETNVAVVSTPASGSFFPKGTTVVTNVATSLAGNTATCYFTVTVVCDTRLTATVGGNGLSLTWPGTATLERASNVSGPWVPVATGTTSYTAPLTGARGFFRVRY